MIRFYAPDIRETRALADEQAGHCARVLRKGEGDVIDVVDGQGTAFRCEILSVSPRKVDLAILEEKEEPKFWTPRLVVAVAPTKNSDRMEWLTEKSVETGVDEIVFLRCMRSERKGVNTERMRKIAVAAMKQSLKAVMPVISEAPSLKALLDSEGEIKSYIGCCDTELARTDLLRAYAPGSDAMVIIGPEGDFTPEETALAIERGVTPVTLGPARLRTETAALSALSSLHFINRLNDT